MILFVSERKKSNNEIQRLVETCKYTITQYLFPV